MIVVSFSLRLSVIYLQCQKNEQKMDLNNADSKQYCSSFFLFPVKISNIGQAYDDRLKIVAVASFFFLSVDTREFGNLIKLASIFRIYMIR